MPRDFPHGAMLDGRRKDTKDLVVAHREKQRHAQRGVQKGDRCGSVSEPALWGQLAEFAGKLEKGAHVQIEGELR